MKKIYLFLVAVILSLHLFSQAPAIGWQKWYGGPAQDWGQAMALTADHGYVLTGNSDSSGGQVTGNHGGGDYWVVKTDSAGTIQWEKSYGGSGGDQSQGIQQTRDGGYIVAGLSNSTNGDVSGNHGNDDYWVVKLDNTGTIQWENWYGGSLNDEASAIEQTYDGGYILTGISFSTDGDVTGNHGNGDYWVVKLDSLGNIIWERALGGSSTDYGISIHQTSDRGFIAAGNSASTDGDITNNHGSDDFWVVKMDSLGNITWQNSLGGSAQDGAHSIQQTTDGGYVVTGFSKSNDGDVTGHHGSLNVEDLWVVKLNSTGQIQWERSYGGSGQDWANSIVQTYDGGYIAGLSTSSDGDVTSPLHSGFYEDWVIKISANGHLEWQKSLGGNGDSQDDYDQADAIVQAYDSSFVILGATNSNDGEVSGNHGNFDFSVFKLFKSPPPCLLFTETNSNFNCTRQSDTTVITVTSGTPDSVSWDDGISYALAYGPLTHVYAQPGVYSILLFDSTGCWAYATDSLLNQGISIDTTVFIHPSCNDSVLGEIAVSASGGTSPYSYTWNTGPTTDTIKNLSGGNYSISVTDNTGCLSTMQYDLYKISPNASYYVYCSITQPNCTNNGEVVTQVYNGTPPYTYLWSDSRTTPTITGIGQGDYAVTVTDSVGCVASGNVYVNAWCYNFIYGTVFNDTNHNCIIDPGEQPMPCTVMATDNAGNSYYGITDSTGQYMITVPDTGAYTVTAATGYYGTCTSSQFCGVNPVTFSTMGDSSFNNNFSLTFSGFDLQIVPGWGTVPPCYTHGLWQKWYFIYVINQSPVQINGPVTATFQYDPALQFWATNGNHPYTSLDQATHTFTWIIDTMPPLGVPFYLCGLEFNYLTFNQAYQLQADFKVSPYAGDCDTSNNHYHFIDSLFDSHDPNGKAVSPAGNITEDDSVLTYTIHFQNTGTDTAWFITIVDTLSPNLEPASVRNVAASMEYSSFTLTGTGILTWFFNPALLPDSLTNVGGSMGFITFQVKKKKNLPIGTTISNRASIYFDYNAPVATNTVSDTLANPLYIYPLSNDEGISVKAFPNPFNTETNIVVTGVKGEYEFNLYDLTGRSLKRIASSGTYPLRLSRDELAGGVYLYGITVAGKPVAFGKLVAQ